MTKKWIILSAIVLVIIEGIGFWILFRLWEERTADGPRASIARGLDEHERTTFTAPRPGFSPVSGPQIQESKMKLYRQGDVLFREVEQLPKGMRVVRENATVAYGEVTGHSHALAVEDRAAAEVLEIGDGLYVHVSAAGIRIEGGATFVHEEHGPITLPPGNYEVVIQREYSPEEIRSVVD